MRVFLGIVLFTLVVSVSGRDEGDGYYYKGGNCGYGGPVRCEWDYTRSVSIYLDPNNGDDNNTGGSPESPLQTLQAAVDKVILAGLGNGNIIYLKNTYTGNQIADMSNARNVRTLCILSELSEDDQPSVVFDGDNCELPTMDLRNLKASKVKIGEGHRRFSFTRGSVGIQLSGYSNKVQISNNTFDNQKESAIVVDTNYGSTVIDHNEIAWSCRATPKQCPGRPTYDDEMCAAVDARNCDVDFEYNVVYGSQGYGIRLAGGDVFKNIFHNVENGGYILVEGSDVNINTNWFFDNGDLNPTQSLSTRQSCSGREDVFAIGLAVQNPGDALDDVVIGNNIFNGIAYIIAHFHATVATNPYGGEVCPDRLQFNFGFNTVLNLGAGSADTDGTPEATYAGTLLWPDDEDNVNNNEIDATFHSNIFHYFGDNEPESFLDNTTDTILFFCNLWMFEDSGVSAPAADDLTRNYNTTCFSTEINKGGSESRDDFMFREFNKFFFYPTETSTRKTGDPTMITSWPINFQPNETSSAALDSGCHWSSDSVCYDYNYNYYKYVYKYDFSGYQRKITSSISGFTKGFSEFCNETFGEECRFLIFWETGYHNDAIPQNERYPAPDPLPPYLDLRTDTDGAESPECASPPSPPNPQRFPCNKGYNLFISTTGENGAGRGLNPQQALADLEGAIEEIARLTASTNLCDKSNDMVNIIYLLGDYYDQQYADFSILRVQGFKEYKLCKKINILAEQGTRIFGTSHDGALFDLQNLGGANVWIGDCQGCGSCGSWGFIFADSKSHAIYAHPTIHDRACDGLKIISNQFNNIGESAVYTQSYDVEVQNNLIQHICMNHDLVEFDSDIMYVAADGCFAIDGDDVEEVALNSFFDIHGSGVRCDYYNKYDKCRVYKNIFRDVNLATFVGYNNSWFFRNWAYCSEEADCLYAFEADSRKGDIQGPYISNNLFNGHYYGMRHTQSKQTSPDMDEIYFNDINITLTSNNFMNVKQSYFYFEEQGYWSNFVAFANLFSPLNEYVPPANTEEKIIFLCNTWLCDGPCDDGDFPESTSISEICADKVLSGLFVPDQFESFYWDDGDTEFALLDIYNTSTPPVTYRPCDPDFSDIDQCIFSLVVPTFDEDIINNCTFFGCPYAEDFYPEVYFPWGGSTVGRRDFRDDRVYHRFENATVGFLELPYDNITCPAYTVWWSLSDDPYYYSSNLAPNPQILLEELEGNPGSKSAIADMKDKYQETKPEVTMEEKTEVVTAPIDNSVNYEPVTVDMVEAGSEKDVSLFRQSRDCSSCGSEEASVVMCVESDTSVSCENFFETSAWENSFPDCVCFAGCFAKASCGSSLPAGRTAYTVVIRAVQENDHDANKLANEVGSSARKGAFDTDSVNVHDSSTVDVDIDPTSSAERVMAFSSLLFFVVISLLWS